VDPPFPLFPTSGTRRFPLGLSGFSFPFGPPLWYADLIVLLKPDDDVAPFRAYFRTKQGNSSRVFSLDRWSVKPFSSPSMRSLTPAVPSRGQAAFPFCNLCLSLLSAMARVESLSLSTFGAGVCHLTKALTAFLAPHIWCLLAAAAERLFSSSSQSTLPLKLLRNSI